MPKPAFAAHRRAASRSTRSQLLAATAALIMLSPPLLADEDVEEQAEPLPPVMVTGTRIDRALPDTPGGVSVVDETAIRAGRQGLQLDESLSRVPGLFLQNRFNFAQGQRIAARGFGARAPFGVRGIRIRVDGFPETLPDGQSQVDMIDLDSARRIEVLRGPGSVPFGNAGGGVISVETAEGGPETSASLRLQGGSDDFLKARAQAGGRVDNLDYHVSLSHLDFEGFREQSEVRRTLFNTRLGVQADAHQRVELVLTALDLPKAQDPGGLDAEQVAENRQQALPLAIALDAGQQVEQQRIGARYIHDAVAGGELRVQAFHTHRDFAQQLPFPGASLVAFNRDFSGTGVEYLRDVQLGALPARFIVGADAQRQKDERTRFMVSPAGEVGDQTQGEGQRATVIAAFAQTDIDLLPRLTLSLGGRVDRLRLSIADRLQSNGDASGARSFTESSGSAGLVWRAVGDHRLYAGVSTAFESPTFTEFARLDGGAGFNPDIEPQTTVNRELGVRNGLGGRFHYDLTLFSVRVDDEILPFEEAGGRTFYENAGRTERDGVEVAGSWRPGGGLQTTLAYTWARYRFDRFTDLQGVDQAGNRLPGLPRQTLFAEIAWQGPDGIFLAVDSFAAGHLFADNANATRVPGYALLNLRGAWQPGGSGPEVFAGINNLLDRETFANIRINAAGNRFFEPAPDRTFFAGIALRY